MKIQLMTAQAPNKVLSPIPPLSIEEIPLSETGDKAAAEPNLLQCTQETNKAESAKPSKKEEPSAEEHTLDCEITSKTHLGGNDAKVESTLVMAPQGNDDGDNLEKGIQECPPPGMMQTTSNGFKTQVQVMKTTNEPFCLEHEKPIEKTTFSKPTEPDLIISSGIIIEPIDTSVATPEEPALKLKGEVPQENPDLIITDPTEFSVSVQKGSTSKDGHNHHSRTPVHIGLGLAIPLMLIAVPSAVIQLSGGSERLIEKRSRKHSFQFTSRRSSLLRRHSIQHQSSKPSQRKTSVQ